MIYRQLGRTGLKVSQLGFGAMRLPTITEGDEKDGKTRVDREMTTKMFHRAFEAGVNYVDTAVFYHNEESQSAVGDAIKGWRGKVILSTKNHFYEQTDDEWWRNLENSLERLGVDYIDIYNHHGINWKVYTEHVEPRLSKLMFKAKEQGLIRHICTSFHDTSDAIIKLVDTGYFESITLQYNMLDCKNEDGIAYAHENGVGVVVMGPVAGGMLATPSDVMGDMASEIDGAELAMRFVLANPNVTIALSGMSTMRQVEQNIAIANDDVSLTDTDRQAISRRLVEMKGMADLYCTGCKYCMPCPVEVNIPTAFYLHNLGRVYGLWDVARDGYKNIGHRPKSKNASACIECGDCEDKCPQKIAIRQQLKDAHAALAEDKG